MRPETKNNPDLKRISALTLQSLKTLRNLRPCVGSFKLLRIRGSLRKRRFAARYYLSYNFVRIKPVDGIGCIY